MSDYISREAVLLHLNDIWLSATPTDNMYDDDRQLAMVRCMGLNDAMDVVKEAPAANVRPVVKAHWKPGDIRNVSAVCSNCGHLRLGNGAEWATKLAYFCEKCGADMRPEPPKEGET